MRVGAEAELLARCLAGETEASGCPLRSALWPRHPVRVPARPGFHPRRCGRGLPGGLPAPHNQEFRTFQGQSQFQTWLFRIAANKARDYRQHLRAAKRGSQIRRFLFTRIHARSCRLRPGQPQAGPDLALLQAEQISLVGDALDELGGPCQEIIELRYFADLSYEEIAASLELNPKTVSSRLSNCLNKLESVTRRLLARVEASTPTKKDRENRAPTSV